MNFVFRSLAATAAGAALLGVVGCSNGVSGSGETPETSTEPAAALKSFDVCSFFTPDDLNAAGVAPPGQPETQLEFEPGCVYEGDSLDLALYKNERETVGSYAKNGSWGKYEQLKIGDRQAARAIEAGGTGQGCSVLLNAGGGVVLVDVTKLMPDTPVDPCAKAQEIATKIEPRLPE